MEDRNDHSPVIVVADDGEAFHYIIKSVLKNIGVICNLVSVNDGLELMEFLCHRGSIAHTVTPDLVILDLEMPRKDGRTALREIKSAPILRSIPVVVMSSSFSNDDVQLCLEFGCQYFIKPIDYDQWVEKIRGVVKEFLKV